MSLGVRYLSQVFDKASNKVIEEKVLHEDDINFASDIDEFGLRHKYQINLIGGGLIPRCLHRNEL
jgi:hypothetical protein